MRFTARTCTSCQVPTASPASERVIVVVSPAVARASVAAVQSPPASTRWRCWYSVTGCTASCSSVHVVRVQVASSVDAPSTACGATAGAPGRGGSRVSSPVRPLPSGDHGPLSPPVATARTAATYAVSAVRPVIVAPVPAAAISVQPFSTFSTSGSSRYRTR